MTAAAGWQAHLRLHYRRDGNRTVAQDRHAGPLRVLKALYPEGEGICHHVVVHPPGGIVGGDELRIAATLDEGSHALITTPGATRFYRSAGAAALQQAALTLAAGARLEWLPLETIAHAGCSAENQVTLDLAPGAECLGWDLLALGLPAAGEAFDRGCFTQCLHWPGVWLDRGRIRGDDRVLLDSPLGLAGQPVSGTLWFAAGTPWPNARREALTEAARAVIDSLATGTSAPALQAGTSAPALQAATSLPALQAGVTALDERVLVLRTLAPRVEPAMALLQAVRAAWRRLAWDLDAGPPRVWRT